MIISINRYSVNSINRLIFVMYTHCIFYDVGTEFWNAV
jgi:hypothetical protein